MYCAKAEQLLVLLGFVAAGLLVVATGVVLLLWQKTYVDAAGAVVDVEVPFLGKVKTNYPAVLLFVIAAILIFYPTRSCFQEPREVPSLPISGQVHAASGKNSFGLSVGIMSGSHTTITDARGEFSLTVPVERASGFSALLFVPDGGPQKSIVAPVYIDANGRGTVDFTLP